MMKTFFTVAVSLFLMTCSFFGYAQIAVDTIRSENPELADTVVIYEEPVVISSKLEIYRPETKKDKKTFFLSLEAGISFNYDYNNVCAECVDYANKIKASTHKLPAYLYAVQVSFSKGNWISGIAIGTYNQQERFVYIDTSGQEHISINKLKTWDGRISLGYWFGKKNERISVVPSAMFTFSKPYEISGRLYRQDSLSTTDELKKVLDFNQLQYILGLEVKLLYKMKPNVYLAFTPMYNYDLKSIVNRTGPFTIQRNMFGFKLGLMLALK